MIIQRILRDTFISEEHEVRNYESYDHFGIKSDINEKIDSIIEIQSPLKDFKSKYMMILTSCTLDLTIKEIDSAVNKNRIIFHQYKDQLDFGEAT